MKMHVFLQKVVFLMVLAVLFGSYPEGLHAMQNSDRMSTTDIHRMTLADLQEIFYKAEIDQEISLQIHAETLDEALRQIARETGLKLTYRGDIVDKEVTLISQEIRVSDALERILEGTGLDYKFSKDGYLLIAGVDEVLEEMIYQETVSGQVTDAQTGEPLPGVNIVVEGSTIGTTTDVSGEFELTVPALNETLIVTYVGYQRLEVPINGRTSINIGLEPQAIAGEELIVVGYGVQRQRDLSTSVSTVRAEDLNRGTMLSPQQLVQGRMAGVNIMQNSGKPGGSNTVLIRGGTSLTGSSEPLYVIDGVPISTTSTTRQNSIGSLFDQEPVNPLNAINPNDIESITVLKDASATAIYGSRGANGVIVITTKSGRPNDIQTTYDNRAGVAMVSNTLDMLNADQYRQINQDLGLSFGDGGANTNYQDEIFRTALSQTHDLSISGGGEATRYRASLGYGKEQGVVISSDVENLRSRINVSHTGFDDRLFLDMRLSASRIRSNNAPLSNTVGGESGTNIIWDAYSFNPTLPVYNESGEFNHISQFNVNPVSYGKQLEDESITARILGSLSTTYQLFDPLSVNVNLAYTNQTIDRNSYIHRASPLGGGFGGRAHVLATEDWSNLLETTLNYRQSVGANHELDIVGGYSYQYFVDQGSRMQASGFISDAFKWNSIQAASTIETASTFKESNTLISFYSRVNYSFMDRYLVTATLRRDGSSRFGAGNEWGLFPSASFAWRISDEGFFPETNVIEDLKIRISYGKTGNQEIGNMNSITTLGASTSGYWMGGSRQTVVMPQQFANPDLRWEETSQWNVGIDYDLLNGRIYGKVDYYIKETNDLLLNFAVPSPSVVSNQLANVGAVENRGFEFEITNRIIQRANTMWELDLNLSINRNKVLSLSDATWSTEEIVYSSPRGVGTPTGQHSQFIRPGYALGTFWGRELRGVENGVEQFSDETIIGSAEPDFIFGIGNTFFHNNWDLNINLRGSVGNDIFNNTALHFSYLTNLPSRNVLVSTLDSDVAFGEIKQYSDRFIENGSFLRLDNITLGYNFGQVVEGFTFLSDARLFVTGQNLFTITNYSGLDPEVNRVESSGRATLGIDYLAYPRARAFSIGASLSF